MLRLRKRLSVTSMIFLAFATPLAAAEKVIAALGDSLTAGYGLPQDEGLVPQLQAWVNAHGGEVRLINAGVSGDTTAGGLARLDWTLGPEVEGLIVALGGNDMLRGLAPSEAAENLSAIIEAAQARGLPVLLIGFQAPGNWGADYKAEFDAIYPVISDHYGTILMPSFLGPLTEDGSAAEALSLLQADGLHPTAEGVAVIVAEMGPYVLKLSEEID